MILETIFEEILTNLEVPDDENVRGVLRYMFFTGVRTAIELGEDWQQKIVMARELSKYARNMADSSTPSAES